MLSCVQKSYGEIEAIRDASFALTAGEFLSVLGPSGCGKSTLLMMIAGLISPSAGKITVSGSPICGPRREIGIVFQSPVLLPWRSIIDNVLFSDPSRRFDCQGSAGNSRTLRAIRLRRRDQHGSTRIPAGVKRCVSAQS